MARPIRGTSRRSPGAPPWSGRPGEDHTIDRPDEYAFWRDYVDGAQPYFSVPPEPIQVHGRPGDMRWPFSIPGYWMSPMFTLAVGGPGGGDPALGQFPAAMLVDYIRVW